MQASFTKLAVAVKALLTRKLTIECDRLQHNYQDVPLGKILNWLLVESSVLFKPEKPWGLPTHLLVESSSYCNLRCTSCPVTIGLERPSGHMRLELFQKLIDEVGDYVFLILLWDWGEPFLNPHVYDMIAYAKQRDIQIISSTNGHVFSDRSQADKLVRSGLDSLIVAVDGITQKTYEKYRQGGSLEAVLNGIAHVIEIKRALKSSTPQINFRFIAMKHNEHEIPELKAFTERLGVDVLSVRSYYPFNELYSTSTTTMEQASLTKDPAYHRFAHESDTLSHVRRQNNPCKTLWNNPAIHWNGKICPCTFDPNEHHVLGDLSKSTFKEIWSNALYREYRRHFRENYQRLEICANCTNAFEGGACSTEDIIESHRLTGE